MENAKILILNGPNLNLLGRRNPEVYGTTTMEQIVLDIQRMHPDLHLAYAQSNHEGVLIDRIQEVGLSHEDWRGVVLNAGGYTHTSVALRDAVEFAMQQGVPVVEVHISNIYTREAFRHTSFLTDVCAHSIVGHGAGGYAEAIDWILNYEA